jgi:hypothetical protein
MIELRGEGFQRRSSFIIKLAGSRAMLPAFLQKPQLGDIRRNTPPLVPVSNFLVQISVRSSERYEDQQRKSKRER